ncbi:MAG: tRNA pseudouridine(38-40) synthase TruA [Lachnospirales bacterium]
MKIALILSYEGTNYNGFQRQREKQSDKVAIQNVLEDILSDLYKLSVETIGASRTDAGVHALCQVVTYEQENLLPVDKIAIILNKKLPLDIRVVKSFEVSLDFHPRYSKSCKTYEYKIFYGEALNPLYRNFVLHKKGIYNIKLLQLGCERLIGTHDFKGFSNKSDINSTIRTIFYAGFYEKDGYLTFTITGDGFLYNMVRIIVSTLLDIGEGKKNIKVLDEIFLTKNRNLGSATAKAFPLILKEIKYNDDLYKVTPENISFSL